MGKAAQRKQLSEKWLTDSTNTRAIAGVGQCVQDRRCINKLTRIKTNHYALQHQV
jgi:hypothetical protein